MSSAIWWNAGSRSREENMDSALHQSTDDAVSPVRQRDSFKWNAHPHAKIPGPRPISCDDNDRNLRQIELPWPLNRFVHSGKSSIRLFQLQRLRWSIRHGAVIADCIASLSISQTYDPMVSILSSSIVAMPPAATITPNFPPTDGRTKPHWANYNHACVANDAATGVLTCGPHGNIKGLVDRRPT
jgi:hypothetical protein